MRANFAAVVAMKQLSCNGHFLIEKPARSEIFGLLAFQKLWRSSEEANDVMGVELDIVGSN